MSHESSSDTVLNVLWELNRFHESGYDASGNLLSGGYGYDAEERMSSAAGITYTYDGDGGRVRKSNGKLYWTGPGSEPLLESDAAGNFTAEYIFFNGKRVARRDLPGGAVHYYFSDHLGTASVITSNTGVVQKESDYYPYGGERRILDADSNSYKFTGKERDSETGLDYFGARYYGSNMGRFLSPDPKMLSSQRLYDPQQWNMYQYGRNNPITMIDPDGREVKIATQELQKSFDRLMKSEKFRNAVAPYQGKNNPDLIIGRGKLGFDPMEPTRKELGVTKPSIVPVIHNCSSATNCTDIPAKLKSTTITIADSVKEGKGKEQLDGVLGHEVSHGSDAAKDPQGYLDESQSEQNKLHDDRTQEKRADQFSDDVRKEVKQEEKREKKEKKDE